MGRLIYNKEIFINGWDARGTIHKREAIMNGGSIIFIGPQLSGFIDWACVITVMIYISLCHTLVPIPVGIADLPLTGRSCLYRRDMYKLPPPDPALYLNGS